MKLSDIELIVRNAEKACAAVVAHPADDRALVLLSQKGESEGRSVSGFG